MLVDLRSLVQILGLDDHKLLQHKEYTPEQLSKYLLARIQAKKDLRGNISLFLAKVHEHETLPALLVHGPFSHHSHHNPHGLPTDLAVRRRHTFDDVKEAQKEVQDAAVELKKARVQAEHLSNLARLSLDAFSKRGQKPERSSKHSEWVRVYDRVTMKNAVEHSKDFLHAFEKH